MTLTELMAGRTPNPAYEGPQTADDMVLAVNFGDSGADPGTFLVAQVHVTEHSGAIGSTTQTVQYIRSGEITTRTGAGRTITINGDRYWGDPFQDTALSHDSIYGTGGDVIHEYVYFSIRTGLGERGSASLDVTADHEGVAGDNDGFSATLTSDGTPQEYTYTPAP